MRRLKAIFIVLLAAILINGCVHFKARPDKAPDRNAIAELNDLLRKIPRSWEYKYGVFDCSNMSAFLCDYLSQKGYKCEIMVGWRPLWNWHAWLVAEKDGWQFWIEPTGPEVVCRHRFKNYIVALSGSLEEIKQFVKKNKTFSKIFGLLHEWDYREEVWIESYDKRKVICAGAVKFEFNDGEKLSAVYWQKDSLFGYLFDLRSEKLFINVSSGIFFRRQADFYESLERDVDWQKVQDSLTPDILKKFCRAMEKAGSSGIFNSAALRDLDKARKKIKQIDLEKWKRAVEREKGKIHGLGLEYCVGKKQAEKMLLLADFSRDYKRIVGEWLNGEKQAVVCLGENHSEDADKIEAIRIFNELKPLDFGYALFECVLKSRQKILDDYVSGDSASKKALIDFLKSEGWGSHSSNLGGRGVEPYFEMIDCAKRLGYRLIAIGNHQRDEIEAIRDNYWMALNVAEILEKDPNARIIAVTGATHAFPNYIPESDVVLEGYLMRQDIPDIVRKIAGVRSITFECIGGFKDAEYRNYLNPENVLEKHIEKKGWAEERFFIPVLSEISALSAEAAYYYVHLPQTSAPRFF
jgi:hypothetical protein